MNTDHMKLGRTPIGYLTNAQGCRTHAIVPLIENDDWNDLPMVEPDAIDRAFLVKFDENPTSYLDHAPVDNPIRSARIKARVTQDTLAKKLGISAAALSKQEQEGHAPRPRTIERALSMLEEIQKTRL